MDLDMLLLCISTGRIRYSYEKSYFPSVNQMLLVIFNIMLYCVIKIKIKYNK